MAVNKIENNVSVSANRVRKRKKDLCRGAQRGK